MSDHHQFALFQQSRNSLGSEIRFYSLHNPSVQLIFEQAELINSILGLLETKHLGLKSLLSYAGKKQREVRWAGIGAQLRCRWCSSSRQAAGGVVGQEAGPICLGVPVCLQESRNLDLMWNLRFESIGNELIESECQTKRHGPLPARVQPRLNFTPQEHGGCFLSQCPAQEQPLLPSIFLPEKKKRSRLLS